MARVNAIGTGYEQEDVDEIVGHVPTSCRLLSAILIVE